MTRLVLSLAATLIALVDANVLPTKTLLMLHGSGQTSSAFLISPTKRGAKHFLSGMPWPNRFKLNWKYKAIDAGNAEGSWMEDVDASVAAIEMAIEEEGISGLVGFEEGGTVAAVVAARKATRLKFAVICAAAMPTDASHTALLNQLRDSPDATIPTLHCLSKADSMSAQGEALAACFAPGGANCCGTKVALRCRRATGGAYLVRSQREPGCRPLGHRHRRRRRRHHRRRRRCYRHRHRHRHRYRHCRPQRCQLPHHDHLHRQRRRHFHRHQPLCIWIEAGAHLRSS